MLDVGLFRRRPRVPDDLRLLLDELVHKGGTADGALLESIRACGPRAVGPLIAVATDARLLDWDEDAPEAGAPLHAIQLLGELGAAEAVAPLLPLLHRWEDDLLQETLAEALGRIGQPAIGPLRAMLFHPREDPSLDERAVQALTEVGLHDAECRRQVIDALVARLDAAARPSPEGATLNAIIISSLLDLEAAEAAPAITDAFLEDRVDVSLVNAADVRSVLGDAVRLPPAPARKGIQLHLQCTDCNHSRHHDVKTVYYDAAALDRRALDGSGPQDDDIVIPQRITCPKCGAADRYRLTPMAYFAITASLLAAAATRGSGRRQDPLGAGPVRVVHFGLADGTKMHPRAACRLYQERLAADPFDPDLRLRYGNILSFLGYLEEAKEQYRTVVTVEPQSLDALLNLGRAARATGDGQEARSAFERLLLVAPTGRALQAERGAYVSEAEFELAELALPPEPWSTDIPVAFHFEPSPREQRGPQAPPALRNAPNRKVGRNDSCPCGSGMKYKKCHGR